MESIFRHKAVYLAKEVLFTNQFFFAVRRENPISISNTWNFIDIIPIRMEAYRELVQWHYNYNPEDFLVWKRTMEEIVGMMNTYFYLALNQNNSYKEFINKINDLEIDQYIKLIPEELSQEKFRILNAYKKYPYLRWIKAKTKKIIKKMLPKRVRSTYPLSFDEIECRTKEFSDVFIRLSDEIKQIKTT